MPAQPVSRTLTLPAPAKINRFLHVCGRRPDGYHNLQTVFQFLDYGDTLHFELRQDRAIELLTPLPGVANADNLIVKAAKALQLASKSGLGCNIRIDKRLPMGGGIGGGSSNAATTLVALNQLWQLNKTDDELKQLGLALGADVPIFIHGKAAWAEGVGEELSDIELDEPYYLIVIPPVHVSTAEIFCHKELTRDSLPIKVAAFLAGAGRNDCQDLVAKLHPEVANSLKWLDNFSPSRMSGTGACIFAPFADETAAQQVLQQLPEGLQGFVARGRNLSPLRTALLQ